MNISKIAYGIDLASNCLPQRYVQSANLNHDFAKFGQVNVEKSNNSPINNSSSGTFFRTKGSKRKQKSKFQYRYN